MKAALEALAPLAGSLDAVIWAGVGHGAELESVRALGGRQCYVEPHPGLRRRIAARIGSDGGASVLAEPLWTADGTGVFHIANDAVSSTLLPPSEAWAGRPNVRVVQEVEVETVSLATLLDSLALDERATTLLVLDIGGGEDDLIAGCEEPVLRRLGEVLVPVRCGKAAARLQELGYVRDAAGEHWYRLHRPARAPRGFEDEIEQLSLLLAARSAEVEEQARALELAGRELEALRGDKASLEHDKASLEAERDEALAARAVALRERDEQAALAGSLQDRLAALQRDSTAAAAAAETLRSEREAETARATSLQQQLTAFSQESAQTIAALTKERDTAIGSLVQKTSLADELEASRNQLQASSNQLQERVGKLEAELQEARRSVALSLKLQAQRNADLDDLQARYRESQEVQERQRQLLERLGERLGVASRYFHQLADERGKA